MTRRFWISLVLTLPVFVIAMAEMIPGQPLQKLLPTRFLTRRSHTGRRGRWSGGSRTMRTVAMAGDGVVHVGAPWVPVPMWPWKAPGLP
ncbi:hypothetical protein ANAEL_03545 [Anaerolineales bacterium]|nr:hypothetical protein [Geobacter sp.]CAG1007508.1 hypothetical protein ANAEL_03545 [Anaerolineales bacterium]